MWIEETPIEVQAQEIKMTDGYIEIACQMIKDAMSEVYRYNFIKKPNNKMSYAVLHRIEQSGAERKSAYEFIKYGTILNYFDIDRDSILLQAIDDAIRIEKDRRHPRVDFLKWLEHEKKVVIRHKIPCFKPRWYNLTQRIIKKRTNESYKKAYAKKRKTKKEYDEWHKVLSK